MLNICAHVERMRRHMLRITLCSLSMLMPELAIPARLAYTQRISRILIWVSIYLILHKSYQQKYSTYLQSFLLANHTLSVSPCNESAFCPEEYGVIISFVDLYSMYRHVKFDTQDTAQK